MEQKSKCGCVHDIQDWGLGPMAIVKTQCEEHKKADIEALKRWRAKREARKK